MNQAGTGQKQERVNAFTKEASNVAVDDFHNIGMFTWPVRQSSGGCRCARWREVSLQLPLLPSLQPRQRTSHLMDRGHLSLFQSFTKKNVCRGISRTEERMVGEQCRSHVTLKGIV